MSTAPRLGRKFSIAQAAAFLGMSIDQLRKLCNQRRITHHVMPQPARTHARTAADGRVVRYVRAGNRFFYEHELVTWQQATTVAADSPRPAAVHREPVDMAVARLLADMERAG